MGIKITMFVQIWCIQRFQMGLCETWHAPHFEKLN